MTGSRRDGLLLLLVLALGGALFLTAAASRRFVGPDEPRYACIAREMAARGDPVVLTLDGKLYREKPPLWFGAAALGGALVGGFTDLAVRLPSVISAVLLLLVIARLGVRLLGDLRTGALAAVVYALSVQGLNMAHRAYLDTMLTLFTTAAVLVFLGGLQHGRSGFRAHAAGWIAVGLGVLVKGPPALLPPLLAVAGWAAAHRDPGALRRVAPLRGLALALVVVGIWFGPWAASVGLQEVRNVWTLQVAGRAVSSHAHANPWWFYLEQFPVQFLPWTLLLPTLAVAWVRRREGADPALRTLLAWFVAGLLVFSLVSGKRPVYLLPFYPAAALLVAAHLARAGRTAATIAALLPALVGTGLVIVVGAATLPVVLVAVGAAAISSTSLVLVIGGKATRGARLATIGLLALAIPAAAVLGPVSDDRRSARDLVDAARRHARPDDTRVRYRTGDRALDWSTGRRWRWAGGEDKVARLRAEGRLLLVGDAEKMREITGLEVLEAVVYDGDDWLIGRLSGPTTARPGPGR